MRSLLRIAKLSLISIEERIMSWILIDIYFASMLINLFGARGPYDKYEWFFYSIVYFLSKKHLRSDTSLKN